jgi:hypothetical protein
MIEKIVMDYLDSTLSVPTYMEQPEEKVESYVLIEKIGSSKENFIESTTITLKSYAGSLVKAAKLNEEVKKAMDNIISLDCISKSKLNSDYNFTDTAKKQYRYQAVYDLVY